LPLDWFGLFGAMLMGGLVYLASAVVLDVGEVRSLGCNALRNRIRANAPALTD
jgi:hypothetical protein